MPVDIADAVAGALASVTITDMSGKKAVTTVPDLSASVTSAQVEALVTAMGNASNGAVSRYGLSVTGEIPVADQVCYDEAFAGANVKANFVFQDSNLQLRKFSLAAPDASLFYAGYKQVKSTADSALVAAIVTAYLALVNAGGGDFVFVKAYREGFAEYATPNIVITEPGVGSSPPQLPASEPI